MIRRERRDDGEATGNEERENREKEQREDSREKKERDKRKLRPLLVVQRTAVL